MASSPPSINPYAPPAASTEIPQLEAVDPYAVTADRSTRFGAYVVDCLLFVPTLIPGILGSLAFQESLGLIDDDPAGVAAFYALLLPVPLLLAIYQWYLVATTGQSLAKRWFRIKIVRMDGSLPGFVYGVLLRSWVLHALNSACSCVGLIDALMIFGYEARCLHDHIAGTKVIKA
jgi:uncharacterized RDD family membrane protein YckC